MATLLKQGAPMNVWVKCLYNRLEGVVLHRYPEVQRIKRALTDHGAVGVLLAGSGATVFGIVSSQNDGLRIKRILEGTTPWKVWVARSVRRGITIQG